MKNKLEKTLNFLITLPIIFTFSGLFLYENSGKNFLFIVAISCLASLYLHGTSHIIKQIQQNKLIVLLLLISSFGIVQNVFHGYSNGIIKTYFSLALYFSITPTEVIRKITKHLHKLIIIATFSSVVFYIDQVYINGNMRGSWDLGALNFTVFSAWLAGFGFLMLVNTNKIPMILVATLCVGINIFMINEAQARSNFLSCVLIFSLIVIYRFRYSPKLIFASFLTISVFATLTLSNSSAFEQRITQTKQEITHLLSGNLDSSIGHRLQMWEAAIIIIKKHPIFGVGDAHKEIKRELAKNNKISDSIVEYNHYHNDYINAFVKNGVFGLIFIVLTLYLPLHFFSKNNNISNIPMLSLFIVYFISALTNVPFTNLQLTIFFFMIYWIYSCSTEIIHSKTS